MWTGVLVETLKVNKILFCGRGLNFFPPLRSTNSKTAHNLLCNVSRLNTPKVLQKLYVRSLRLKWC